MERGLETNDSKYTPQRVFIFYKIYGNNILLFIQGRGGIFRPSKPVGVITLTA